MKRFIKKLIFLAVILNLLGLNPLVSANILNDGNIKYSQFIAFYEQSPEKALDNFWNTITPDELQILAPEIEHATLTDKGTPAEILCGTSLFWEKVERSYDKTSKQFESFAVEEKKVMERIDRYNTALSIGEQSSSGGGGEGNTFTYEDLVNYAVKGDVMFADNGGLAIQGAINHAGIYDGLASQNALDVILSADESTGVAMQSTTLWGDYFDFVSLAEVINTTNDERTDAYDTVATVAEIGETYDIWNSSKENTDTWYCSKIPWYGYKNSGQNIDIDKDGGALVSPADIYYSPNVNIYKEYS